MRELRQTKGLGQLVVFGKTETDVHREVGLVVIFDLGLGQRRAAVEAPVHRLQATEHVARVIDLAQRADLVSLIARRHRQYGFSHSPSTPRRMKSLRCLSICSVA